MFNTLLIQAIQDGEFLTTTLTGVREVRLQNTVLNQYVEVAHQFMTDADAVIRLTKRVVQFEPLGGDRSGNHL